LTGGAVGFSLFTCHEQDESTIYDTTLRDGAQGEGISFSSADKVRIAERLDAFGVHYIEGGWPGSNPKDMDFFAEAGQTQVQAHAKIAAFGSTRRANTKLRRTIPR
jgi:2-isopropylmalate synthase